QHHLRLRHDGGELAVAAHYFRLPYHRPAAAVQWRAFRGGGIADRNAGKEVGLALDGGRGLPRLEVGGGGGAAEIVGERHDGAAMHDAVAVVEFRAYVKF